MTLNFITIISNAHGKPTPRRPLWQPQKSALIIVSAIQLPAPFRAHPLDDSGLGLKPQAVFRCRSAAYIGRNDDPCLKRP